MKTIYIILGSTREGRNGKKVARWIYDVAQSYSNKDLSFVLIDLRDWQIPFFNDQNSPKTGTYSDPIVKRWADTIEKADGFIIVSPEYNHGYPAVLKNVLDVIYAPWNHKPVAFVSYGAFAGGVRAVEQLRLVAIELKLIPIREEVNIPAVWQAFNPDGSIINTQLVENAKLMLDELAFFINLKLRGDDR